MLPLASIVATLGLAGLTIGAHVPPVVTAVSFAVLVGWHTFAASAPAFGFTQPAHGATVIATVSLQPAVVVYINWYVPTAVIPVTLFPEIVTVAGVVPICDHVPPVGLGDKVILVAKVFVAAFTQTNVVSLPALGFGFTVTTTFAVSLQPAAFCATNT